MLQYIAKRLNERSTWSDIIVAIGVAAEISAREKRVVEMAELGL